MLRKMRSIVVDGERYLWRFAPRYVDQGRACRDVFVAFGDEIRSSPLRIVFETWECPIIGGPLRVGAPLDLAKGRTAEINLHMPRWAATLIRAGLERGWQPRRPHAQFLIADGVALLATLPMAPQDGKDAAAAGDMAPGATRP
jgi:hypothetical protein